MQPIMIDLSPRFGFERAHLSDRAIEQGLNAQKRILEVNDLIPDGWPVGYEIDACKVVPPIRLREDAGADLAALVSGFQTRASKDLDKVSQRPELELCLHNLWDHCDIVARPQAKPLTRADLDFLAGRLGTETRWREMRSAITPSGHRLLFSAAANVEERLGIYLEHFNREPDHERVFVSAIDSYLNFLIIHPFRDGNGFAARGLFQLYLNRHLGLKAPVFPITPLYYRNLDAFQFGYLSWALAGDGAPLTGLFAQSIGLLADFFEAEVKGAERSMAG